MDKEFSEIIKGGIKEITEKLDKHPDIGNHTAERVVQNLTTQISGDTNVSEKSILDRKIEKGGVK